MMNICVFGLWHLGCVTAASLADLNLNIIGLDFDQKNIKNLSKGKSPLFEPGLDDMIRNNIKKGNLSFTDDASKALSDSEYIWITFDTPVDGKDNADIDFVRNKLNQIFDKIKNNTKIIISSQVPVGFTAELEKLFLSKYPDKKCYFAYSPENLRLGKAIEVFKNPDRIVAGVRNPEDKDPFLPLLSSITKKIEWMKTESAEMTKHAINSFLATSVVFANEIASICESVGADAKEVARGLKSEERIGSKAYVGPGLAFAGGTLARDINFLIHLSKTHNKKSFLFESVKKSNLHHKDWIKNKCLENFRDLKNLNFGLLGLTYKPNTSTLRRSQVVELAKWINKSGGNINSFDPLVDKISGSLKNVLNLKESIDEVIDSSNIIILGTEHQIFKTIDFNKFNLNNKIIIDPTSFLENFLKDLSGIKYISVGRG